MGASSRGEDRWCCARGRWWFPWARPGQLLRLRWARRVEAELRRSPDAAARVGAVPAGLISICWSVTQDLRPGLLSAAPTGLRSGSGAIRPRRWTAEGGCPHMSLRRARSALLRMASQNPGAAVPTWAVVHRTGV